jgi:hypothetical protein
MRFRLLGLLLWLYLTLVLGANNIGNEKPPIGKPKITLDYSLSSTWPKDQEISSQSAQNFFWSSHITFNEPVDEISDGQL